ncbi:MAG TPA: glycine cleavage system aminomethyltransferase GcvT [Polyangiaceae bacterium]
MTVFPGIAAGPIVSLADPGALVLRTAVTDERLNRSPLYEIQKSLGARFVPFAGWEMPVQFKGLMVEHHAVRRNAGVFDVSHMGRLKVTGANALAFVDGLVTNSLDGIANGRAVYGCCCNEQGGILDDLICYRESTSSVLVICNASNREKIVAHFRARVTNGVTVEDISDKTALVALQGPLAFDILQQLGADWARKLGKMDFAHGRLAGVEVTLASTGYTGEVGVEIISARSDVPKLYDSLLDGGGAFGLEPCGLGARDTLRLEARLSLYGNEIDESTNPIEAGLAWTVKLSKPDFTGKSALSAVRRATATRVLVGLEMLGRGIARHGYGVKDLTNHSVGTVTSGAPSPTLGKNIALAYVPPELAAVGTRVLVDCRGKDVEAAVVPTPFYKRAAVG